MTKAQSKIHFTSTLFHPAVADSSDNWTFLRLPQEASDKLPTRSMSSVEGTFNGFPFYATLEPDGQGGHWLKVDEDLRKGAKAKVGDVVTLEIAPMTVEPEPKVPEDILSVLKADPEAWKVWLDTTAIARRDWISWITSGKKAETRGKRIEVARSKLASGKKRACCFDRSGMYSNSLSCPVAKELD